MRAALRKVCEQLVNCDPDIVEIIQFGSSVYIPTHAKDADLLVITWKRKSYSDYLGAIDRANPPFDVDIVVVEVGSALRPELLRSVLGAFGVLYGDGSYLLRYAKTLGDPSFEEARAALRAAADYIELAEGTKDALLKDRHAREAFNALFHAARIASMVYLSTKVARWGLIRRKLPEPHRSRFEEFISVLHIEYFYHGNYPKNRIKDEFERWHREVEEYVRRLDSELRSKLRS